MRKEFSTTKPAILRLSSQTLPAILFGVLLVFSLSANAQQLPSPPIDIKPSAPIKDYVVPRDLFPGESTDIQVNVTSTETHNNKEYTLVPGSPKIVLDKTKSIWTTNNVDGETSLTFSILNAGKAPARHEFKVEASWSTTAGGGGGGGGEQIDGSAIGAAYTNIPVFTWVFNPRLQFADNQSLIEFSATTAISGATLNLSGYNVEGPSSWTIVSQASQSGVISGTVKSNTPSKGKLKIKYQGNDIDESADEIAFAKADLAIASFGSEPDLKEDRKPNGGLESPPHEMSPGGIVLVPIEVDGAVINTGKRVKFTITGNGVALADEIYTLTVDASLTKMKFYEAAEGGDPITLAAINQNLTLTSPKILYIGAEAFKPNDQVQEGKISLTYKLPLQAGGQTHEIKDEVKVTLTPIEVIELSPKVKDEEGNDIAGSEKPNWGSPLTPPFVEENSYTNKIAHRELKVRIGSAAMANKKVTWTLEALPGATPATIRGDWQQSPTHKNCFEKSAAYEEYGFTHTGTGKDTQAETTVGNDGHTAIRVNVPPIEFNQARIKIQVEGMGTPMYLIDMEVPAVVVIDPGHGKNDSGTPARSDTNIKEKNLTLTYGTKLRDELIDKFKDEKRGIRLIMTRDDDSFIALEDRAPYAKNNGADVFLSIHFNDADSTSARGTETFVERTPGNKNQGEDASLAKGIQASTLAAIKTQDSAGINRPTDEDSGVSDTNGNLIPGVKSAGYLVTKDGTGNNGNIEDFKPVKACLVEVEFLSNTNALNSVKVPGTKGEAIRDAFAENTAKDIYNDILNQP